MRRSASVLLLVLSSPLGVLGGETDSKTVEVPFRVDGPDGKTLPCRVHLADSTGKPHQPPGLPFWKDHFVCDGSIKLKLAPGRYRYEIERGPEWQRVDGILELTAGHDHTFNVKLDRLTDLALLGWYSGDLHVHRPIQEIELLMRAEDLHVAPVITWWNTRNAWEGKERPRELRHRFDGNRFYHVMAGEDERGGGALLYFHLDEPLAITKAAREFPPSLRYADDARQRGGQVWIDIEKPFWWDVPYWLASGQMNSIEIANNHMCRSQMYANEAWGRPRDEKQFPPPLGNGQWTQAIYYQILNCGLRLPPSAGSASGVLPNPVGYNRVYVHVDGDLTYEKWWAGLRAGRSFVTNGPLLLCKANDQLPGHVFQGNPGQRLELKLDMTLVTKDRVPKLEIIKDGQVYQKIDLIDETRQNKSARLSFDESGWFLIRAVTDNKQTYRFASTAPFYVEVGEKKNLISKKSVQFFLDWAGERIERLERVPLADAERREIRAMHDKAVKFWRGLLEKATCE
jgi:hypothetical protein